LTYSIARDLHMLGLAQKDTSKEVGCQPRDDKVGPANGSLDSSRDRANADAMPAPRA